MTLINEGTWKARATEAVLGKTNGGKEQVAVGLRILEGPDTGKTLTWYGYFTDLTFERTIESLQHLGWYSDDLNDLSTVGSVDVYIVIEHEADQQGEVRARVKWINSGEGGGVALKERLNPGEAASFAQRMKGRVLAAKQKSGKPAPKPNGTTPGGRPGDFVQPPAPASNVQDDDIPF